MELKKCAYCGLNQLKRQADGTFICESCGTLYQPEEDNDHNNMVSDEITDAKVLFYLKSASKCREADDPEGELENLIKVLELDANNTEALLRLGRSYREAGLYQKAISCYQKVLALDPNEPGTYTNLSAAYYSMKDYETAIRYAEIALPLYTEKNYDYVIAVANYALALGMNGDRQKAAVFLDEAEKMGYKNTENCRKQIGLK